MKYLYSAGIYLYNFMVVIASVFNKKGAIMIRGRRKTFKKIAESFRGDDPVFWFHCASLGEFEQGRPVIEKIKEEKPEIKILITFYSPSGYEVRQNYKHAECVAYLPEDTLRNARKMVTLAKPEKVIFVKYEFWYNYLSVLQKKKIPVYLISGIFRPSQPFFRFYGKYFLSILKGFTRLFIQNTNSGELLAAHNINNYTVTGDTRFDRVMAISRKAVEISGIKEFKAGSRLIVAGSTWSPEEEIIAEYLKKKSEDIKFIIAPHNIADANIDRIGNMLNVPCKRYSKLDGSIPSETQVLIIDSIGLLSSIYRYADIAVIGGGFGKGIHNILEAATWSVPVLFGPEYNKFREAVDLIDLGGARVFTGYTSFVTAVDELLNDSELLYKAGRINIDYINENLGATEMITTELLT